MRKFPVLQGAPPLPSRSRGAFLLLRRVLVLVFSSRNCLLALFFSFAFDSCSASCRRVSFLFNILSSWLILLCVSLVQRISLPGCRSQFLSPLLVSSSSSSSSSSRPFSSRRRFFPLSGVSLFSSCIFFFRRRCLHFFISSLFWFSLPVCSRAVRPRVVEEASGIRTARDCRYASSDLEMTMELDKELLRKAAALFPLRKGVKFSYGTAGFRTDAALLPSTVFRMGVLAALRSLCTKHATGFMITASHNPVHENGVKLADPSGGMLSVAWEPYSDMLANAPDLENFLQIVEHIVKRENIQFRNEASGEVLLARDTRPSGEALVSAARQGVEGVRGTVAHDMGILTTPQLHWMVRSFNSGVPAAESDYFHQLSDSFRILLELWHANAGDSTHSEELIVDAANGVGASKLTRLQHLTTSLRLQVRNSGNEGEGLLNDGVGADFVQKKKVLPHGFQLPEDVGKRCASIDGDADRLVYFYIPDKHGDTYSGSVCTLHLLDGDKIAAIFALFIIGQLRILGGSKSSVRDAAAEHKAAIPGYGEVKVAVVQTAYANGASTKYIKQVLGLEVATTPTGVKHLHKKAAQYDIGIYFEANGHGTILFNENFSKWLQDAAVEQKEAEHRQAAKRLVAVNEMVNQAVGDALSGILMVEVVLRYQGWSVEQWDSMYKDLPSRQLKVKVKDRAVIITTPDETHVASPSSLQEAIDAEVGKYEGGRAFVRPSGTEDVVRVYAEASTQQSADALAQAVCVQVYHLAGGIDPEP